MLRSHFKLPVLTGASLSPKNLHLVQIGKTRNGFIIQHAQKFNLPADIFAQGKVAAFDKLSSTLGSIAKETGLVNLKASLCLPASQVNMQRMVIPCGLSVTNIQELIVAQLIRSRAVKSEAVAMDFQVVRQVDEYEIEIFYAAARQEEVEQYCQAFRVAGWQVILMDVDILAMLRAVRFALRQELTGSEKICALYLYEDYAVIAGVHEHHILFHQQWGGSNMPCLQWVEWCCHTYQHLNMNVVAIGGHQDFIYEAVKILAPQWRCKIYEPDPFHNMQGKSALTPKLMQDNASAFLLASGLALKEVMPW